MLAGMGPQIEFGTTASSIPLLCMDDPNLPMIGPPLFLPSLLHYLGSDENGLVWYWYEDLIGTLPTCGGT